MPSGSHCCDYYAVTLSSLPSNSKIVFQTPESTGTLSSNSWRRHQMETFSALLALCAGNSPVTGEFPAQRPVKRSFDVFSDLCLNKRLSKQSWGWWFETPSRSVLRHCNVVQWLGDTLDYMIGYQLSRPSNIRQGDMPYSNIELVNFYLYKRHKHHWQSNNYVHYIVILLKYSQITTPR